ncbi:MAG: class I SAM-dependent methyltransferase [Rhodospirillaceae bacterium]|jgi:predicted O-methyltransferase YrrM|nr:class I SAM-dependent methyltransferase [Rhodospirillaceae bacterium]MBT5083145.1 class I SAM-dependent methyltransferase [Rhodospirillaceae bacterium]MBT5523345.1 class I SAM-dependent methyltransferase [Rhodospirillaceae bacterium]MBT5877530.1 class I SAM-dependent methyltransferase [Rhodospirillaceae bacterium]MBT6589971.1 class I SAM-dependent methyltransferase [Rhodospirillaceae bacterium]
MHRRSMRLGLLTVLGLARRGFFIPYRYADTLPHPGRNPTYPSLAELMTAAEPTFTALLQDIDRFENALAVMADEPPPAPRLAQDWFPTLDATAAYALVRTLAPKRIIEVGSGHSTRFMKRAVDDGGLDTHIIAIDPQPRRYVDRLDIEFLKTTLSGVDLNIFSDLAAGDILFIDSSHILMPGSDVDDLFNRVIPTLPPGALVHIHDIFLPDDYPMIWDWRGYNEQLGVAPMLAGGAFEILFASNYVATRMAAAVAASAVGRLPGKTDSLPASLWLRKK